MKNLWFVIGFAVSIFAVLQTENHIQQTRSVKK